MSRRHRDHTFRPAPSLRELVDQFHAIRIEHSPKLRELNDLLRERDPEMFGRLQAISVEINAIADRVGGSNTPHTFSRDEQTRLLDAARLIEKLFVRYGMPDAARTEVKRRRLYEQIFAGLDRNDAERASLQATLNRADSASVGPVAARRIVQTGGYRRALTALLDTTRFGGEMTGFHPQTGEQTKFLEARQTLMGAALMAAEPVYVTGQISRLVASVAAQMPDTFIWDGPITYPHPVSYFYFEEPVPIAGIAEPMRWLLLAQASALADDPNLSNNGWYVWATSQVPSAENDEHQPLLIQTLYWPFGISMLLTLQRSKPEMRHSVSLRAMFGFIAALQQFLEQELLVTAKVADREGTHPNTIRRAQQTIGRVPTVRTIYLRQPRRATVHDPNNVRQPREWSCQWIVAAHVRNQWYPSKQRHHPRIIMPYVKGNPERPIREPARRIFAVVR